MINNLKQTIRVIPFRFHYDKRYTIRQITTYQWSPRKYKGFNLKIILPKEEYNNFRFGTTRLRCPSEMKKNSQMVTVNLHDMSEINGSIKDRQYQHRRKYC